MPAVDNLNMSNPTNDGSSANPQDQNGDGNGHNHQHDDASKMTTTVPRHNYVAAPQIPPMPMLGAAASAPVGDIGAGGASMIYPAAKTPSAATENTMDFTDLKDSMDAALASVELGPGAEVEAPVDGKEAQLRAMYLAGFRAAAQTRNNQTNPNNIHLQAFKENSENATNEPLVSDRTDINNTRGSTGVVLLPVDSSIAAGVIKLHPPNNASPGSQSVSVPSSLLSAKLSESQDSARRPRRSLTPVSSSPALSATSSPGTNPTGHSNPFPRKLMEMLRKEDSSVVSWLPNGDGFSVRDPDKFIADVLPRYFRHTKLTSFQRQVSF